MLSRSWTRRLRGAFGHLAVTIVCRLLAIPFIGNRRRRFSIPSSDCRLIVIKPGALGDVLMAGPFLYSLRQAWPSARITMLVGSWSSPAAAGLEGVDELIDCGPVGTPGAYSLQQLFGVAATLRDGRFDAAFVLDRSPLMTLLPLLARIPLRVGLDSGGRGFSLTHRVPVARRRRESEIYLDVARKVGISALAPRRWYRPADSSRARARSLLSEWSAERSGYLVVAPGGGVNAGSRMLAKRWDPAGFAAVARILRDDCGLLPVLVGSASDTDSVAQVLDNLGNPAANLLGQLEFDELAVLLEDGGLFIANDSAPAHLGAAVGATGAVLYTVTDPAIYAPPSALITILASGRRSARVQRAVAVLAAARRR